MLEGSQAADQSPSCAGGVKGLEVLDRSSQDHQGERLAKDVKVSWDATPE